MATYFVGMGLDSYVASPAGVQNTRYAVGFGGTADPYYADCILRDPSTGLQVAPGSFWFHAQQYGNGSNSYMHGITFFNSDGVPVLQTTAVAGETQQIEVFRNGAWAIIGKTVATGGNFLWDIRVVAHPTQGRLVLNINGVMVFDENNIDTSYLSGINRIRLGSAINGNWSQATWFTGVIVASYNTIGHTVRLRIPSSTPTNTGWTGDHTDIDDDANSDADAINTSTVGATMTFGSDPLTPTVAGSVIKAVAVAARIRNDGGDIPRNAKVVLNVDGNNYSKPYNLPVSPGFAGVSTIFEKNPATGLSWGSVAEVNQPFGLTATE